MVSVGGHSASDVTQVVSVGGHSASDVTQVANVGGHSASDENSFDLRIFRFTNDLQERIKFVNRG